MGSIAHSVFMDSELGVATELPHAGSTLEHPLVFDSAAREIQGLARRGLAEILSEHASQVLGESLITRMVFKRLR